MNRVLLPFISLTAQRELSPDEIPALAEALLDPDERDEDKATFLTALSQRGETAAELASFARAFLPHARSPHLSGSWHGIPMLDCCGTGGGGLNLLNISTGMIFVLAALGVPVVKHGNRGMTKQVGSGDVLEALGWRLDLPAERVPECLERVGAAFLFAPAYHPSFARLAPIRRALAAQGQRTMFNLLGPLLNPAQPESRLVGVFKTEHLALYHQALGKMNCPRFAIICGQDAETGIYLGEASAHGTTFYTCSLPSGEETSAVLQRRSHLPSPHYQEMIVRDTQEAAGRLEKILLGQEHGLGRETLLMNVALALWVHGTSTSLDEGLSSGREALESGAAHRVLLRAREFFQT